MLFGKKSEKKKKPTTSESTPEKDNDSGLSGDSAFNSDSLLGGDSLLDGEALLGSDSVSVKKSVPIGGTGEATRTPPAGRAKVMSISIKDRKTLHAAYMPFVESGGIFVPSTNKYKIGEEVFLLLKLIDSTEQISISGKVVWVTAEGAQGSRQPGIGIQFTGADANQTRTKIEGILGGALKSRRTTHTM